MWRVGRCYQQICSMLQPVLCGVCTTVFFLWRSGVSERMMWHTRFRGQGARGQGLCGCAIGGTIVLWFDDIFAMFNLHPLHYTFVRLFSQSMEMRIIRDKTPDIMIVDPFYMRAKLLCSAGDRQVASSHLEDVILANPDKDNFLVAYFPE